MSDNPFRELGPEDATGQVTRTGTHYPHSARVLIALGLLCWILAFVTCARS